MIRFQNIIKINIGLKMDKKFFNARPAEELLQILVCPLTKSEVFYDEMRNEIISDAAGLAFPVEMGIPIMLVDRARKLNSREI